MANIGTNRAKNTHYTRCTIRNRYGKLQRFSIPYVGSYVKNSNPPKPTRKRSSNAEAKILRLLQDIERCFTENIEANFNSVPALAGADEILKRKLVKHELVKLGESDAKLYKLDDFFEFCLDREELRIGAESNSITKSTFDKWHYTAAAAKDFFNHAGITDIRDVTPDHANEFRDHRLKNRAASTVHSDVKYLRTVFFKKAVDRRLLHINPFKKTKVILDKNQIADRRQVINPLILEKVGASITNFNWKLYWHLVRWTGARASEPLKLKWRAVCFGTRRITMPAPKTAKMGVPVRQLPIFDELLPILEEAFHRQKRPSPESYVVCDISNLPATNREDKSRPAKNLGTDINRFIRKAGVEPWAKPLQNLRVTREDELLKSGDYSDQAVHAFIGHSSQTYLKNYQAALTDQDFIPKSQRQRVSESVMEKAS